jgi:LAO/AO transport system kinase
VIGGDRSALGQAITLIESRKPADQSIARDLLHGLLPHTGRAQRVGVSGVPGVGKSTFIEALGIMLLDRGHKVAVLAVDPTSTRTQGSILGDKTRMVELARRPEAFIRPSPSAGSLGGVTRRTRESVLVCEAAGFDVVLVETMGVGQAEMVVAGMVDVFLLLMLPGGGDELQGIKRGILEVTDVIAVNKADGDQAAEAIRTQQAFATALRLVASSEPDDVPDIVTCSALEGNGIAEVWAKIEARRETRVRENTLEPRRRAQNLEWMWSMVEDGGMRALRSDEELDRRLDTLETEVRDGAVLPTTAAEEILIRFLRSQPPPDPH